MRKIGLLILFLLISNAFWLVMEQLNGRSCTNPLALFLGN